MKPGYKTDLKDTKTFKWWILKGEKKVISNYTYMSTFESFGFVVIQECLFVMACYDID